MANPRRSAARSMMIARAVVAWFALFVVPTSTFAQSATLSSARADLASYDLVGDRTLAALRTLGPIAAGTTSDAREARYLRVIAGADLHVAAIGLADTALDARVAAALGVEPADLGAHLRSELAAVGSGVYRSAADEEVTLLSAADVVAAGHTPRTDRYTSANTSPSPRISALYVLSVARAASTPESLAELPTSSLPAYGLVPGWVPARPSAAANVLLSAIANAEAADAGARAGDPLLSAWSTGLASARATLASTTLVVSASDYDIADGEGATNAVIDVLLAVGPTQIRLWCGARLAATGRSALAVTRPSAACPPPGGPPTEIAVPTSLPAVPQPIDALVDAVTALGLASSAVIAIGPDETTPMHLVTRVIHSLTRAGHAATLLALLDADDHTSTSPLVLAGQDAPPITLRVRLGGYTVARTRGRDVQLPRVHGAGFDRDGLAAWIAAEPSTTAIAVDVMGTVPAAEMIRAQRILASHGAGVTLVLP